MTCAGDKPGIESSIIVQVSGFGIGAYGAAVQSVIEGAWKANPSLFTGGLLAKATVLSAFPDLLTVTIATTTGDGAQLILTN